MSLALANRSAVLFGLKAYHLALDDIKLALESGYPDELAYKLYDRQAKISIYPAHFGRRERKTLGDVCLTSRSL